MRWLAAALVAAIIGPGAGADEGLLPGGRRLDGALRRQMDGRLYLVAAARSVRLDQLDSVRLAREPHPEMRATLAVRVFLFDDQQITGDLLGMDADTLRLRTAWAAELRVPRHAIAMVRKLSAPPLEASPAKDDGVILTGGDRILGRIVRADGQAVDLDGRFGSRRLTWADVQGLGLRRQAGPLTVSDGEHVRLDFQASFGPGLDRLDGVVTGLDDRELRLQHRDLGDVRLERGRLRHLHWQFFGQHRALDNRWHHLGGDGLLPGQPIPPERLSLKVSFSLPTVPAKARLQVRVANVAGPGDGTEIAAALDRGLQTMVRINGKNIGSLNRLAGTASPRPRWLALDLAPADLRAGDNQLEIRLTPDTQTGRIGTCDLFGVTLEVPGKDEG